MQQVKLPTLKKGYFCVHEDAQMNVGGLEYKTALKTVIISLSLTILQIHSFIFHTTHPQEGRSGNPS